MPVSAAAIARILEDTALLMELKDENPFKIRAYQNGARALKSVTDDIAELITTGRITDIKGVGKGLAAAISEIHASGRLHEHERLLAEVSPGLVDLVGLPGIGPKKARLLYDELGIGSVGELQYACNENRLAKMKGFGAKSQANLLAAISFLMRNQNRFLYSSARREADMLLSAIAKIPDVLQGALTGDLRRHCEIIDVIEIIVACKNITVVQKKLAHLPGIESPIVHHHTLSGKLACGIPVRFICVMPEAFAVDLLITTGSEAFIKLLRDAVSKRGYSINEGGLVKKGSRIHCENEEDVFIECGLVCVPPELREIQNLEGVLRKSPEFDLVTEKDICGLFHVHTTYSDGEATLAEMASRAQKMGMSYLGISDHSEAAFYASGLKKDVLKKQKKEIAEYNAAQKDFRLFFGIESDILQDGSLDYDATTLKEFDFVIASVHSRFKMSEKEMTERIVTALKNPRTTMLGHMTGRLLLSREAYALDVKKIIDTAVENGKVIELNAHPQRLDIDWRWLGYGVKQGLKISINPDAHNLAGLDDYVYGVGMARKAGLGKRDVINTLSTTEIAEWLLV